VARDFLPYDLDQHYLLPPDMREWLPAGHLVWFVNDVADALDISEIVGAYEKPELRGRPGYHPAMMVKLLLYACCVGKRSSRRLEKATYEELPFRVLSADQHPDHASIAAFRRRHLPALAGLFLQVLMLCRKAGLVKLGHVALDGTKVRASASRHKAMSHERLCSSEEQLAAEVAALLVEAERVDAREDGLYGKDSRGERSSRQSRALASRCARSQATAACSSSSSRMRISSSTSSSSRMRFMTLRTMRPRTLDNLINDGLLCARDAVAATQSRQGGPP